MQKKCRICGSSFETITYGGSRQYCFICVPETKDVNQRTIQKRQAIRKQAIKNLGGKCLKCGEIKEYLIDFHHVNQDEKKHSISALLANSKVELFFKELEKCIPLCSNCHREYHYFNDKENKTIEEYLEIEQINFWKDDLERDQTFIKHFCEDCNKEIVSKKFNNLCFECYKKKFGRQKPSREELKNLVRNNSFVAVSKMFGVTDNAIRKWCIIENIPSKKFIINSYTDEEWSNI